MRPWEIKYLTADELIEACLTLQYLRDEAERARDEAESYK